MRITKFHRIRNYRIFRDFTWSSGLTEFGRFNLIYGWNGSGKTTLSNIFRAIQEGTPIAEGEIQFCVDDTIVRASAIGTEKSIPRVRVFNSDFVRENVFATGQLAPIYILGKESAEKQKEVELLKGSVKTIIGKRKTTQDKIAKTTKELDDFCVAQGKLIREALRSGGNNPYNNYDKKTFTVGADHLLATGADVVQAKRIPEEERESLRGKKDARQKAPIDIPVVAVLDLESERARVSDLLGRTVVSATIAELVADPRSAAWVKQGLPLHVSDEGFADRCHFCDQPLPEDRIHRLEGHFNDQYEKLLRDLDAASDTLAVACNGLVLSEFPEVLALNDHLAPEFTEKMLRLSKESETISVYAVALRKAVEEKRAHPFESIPISRFLDDVRVPDRHTTESHVLEAQRIIKRHNAECAQFEAMVESARKTLEEAYVADAIDDLTAKREAVSVANDEVSALDKEHQEINNQIADLETEIVEHRRPADELNEELCSYLGRDELQFRVEGNGYAITRSGLPAENLSEGEKTALAFLYFLKSLQDKGFSVKDDVVVIDDPISSLDANAIFSAFGFMRERTREAEQLFILTHNFTFFRQVKNWFVWENGGPKGRKKEARFYMLEAVTDTENRRGALIIPLDPLLYEYDSEYHYLFKTVSEKATASASGLLEEHYGMPNVARRLLESFLSFRYPKESGDFREQLKMVGNIDAGVKARIIRFLHTYSHDGRVGEPEHDLSILAETPNIMRDVMALIKAEDGRHYDQMMALITSEIVESADAAT